MSHLCSLLRIGIRRHLSGVAVVNAAEIFSGTDRPVNRASRNPKFFFDVIKQFKRIICITVQLIDKCKARDRDA